MLFGCQVRSALVWYHWCWLQSNVNVGDITELYTLNGYDDKFYVYFVTINFCCFFMKQGLAK
jgi:hypothetical protein